MKIIKKMMKLFIKMKMKKKKKIRMKKKKIIIIYQINIKNYKIILKMKKINY